MVARQNSRTPSREVWLDLSLCVLLLAIAMVTRWLFSRAVVYPPLDDPAFYVVTGRNVAEGRGLVVDVIWSYGTLFSSVTHPSHEHWMPLATGLIAAALTAQQALRGTLEAAFKLAQWPGMVLGALLAPLTYVFGRRHLPPVGANRWMAFAAALLVAANATLSYQSASADSSAPFALLAAWALAISVPPDGERRSYFGAGLLIGLAYLSRSDGLLLVAAVALAWCLVPVVRGSLAGSPVNLALGRGGALRHSEQATTQAWQRAPAATLANIADLLVAFGLVIGPWLIRNHLVFGTAFPGSVLSQAWLTDYAQTFNYESQPTWETMVAQGWSAITAQRGQALLHSGGVFLLVSFAWGLFALPGLWLLRREWSFWPPIVYASVLFLATALVFPVSTVSGTFYHSVGAIVPFIALAAVYAIHRLTSRVIRRPQFARTTVTAAIVGLLVLTLAQTTTALSSVGARHRAERALFEGAAALLRQYTGTQDVIMTDQPYTLHYATGHPCTALPAAEPPDAAWEAAQQYDARFLLITQAFGLYPQVLHQQPDARFRLLEANGTTELYEIVRGLH